MYVRCRSDNNLVKYPVSLQPFCFVAGVARGPYNWLTQSSLDTFADSATPSSQSQSSLLFTVGKRPAPAAGKTRRKPAGPGFGKDRLGDGDGDVTDGKQGR